MTEESVSEELLFEKYDQMTDEELITASWAGDVAAEDFLYEKYKPFIRSRARSYFLIGADREDIIQEGMIGLYKAIRDYNPEKISSFRNFAEICVTRQMITAIKAATRQKHMPLNSYVSLNKPLFSEEPERTLIDVLTMARVSDPEETVISQETYEAIAQRLKDSLSPFERKTLALYLEGLSYAEIAEQLGRQPKAVDNALQRIRHKMESKKEV
ncbi:RNA polymerase sporulation sigma factor SigH [Eubacteriales bacterium OttesenSCG-928-K08]|nr:RNA polymerase sporulation sigma factor SigH [Eubacteriales bacterium OttesenSCG-928-K08]